MGGNRRGTTSSFAVGSKARDGLFGVLRPHLADPGLTLFEQVFDTERGGMNAATATTALYPRRGASRAMLARQTTQQHRCNTLAVLRVLAHVALRYRLPEVGSAHRCLCAGRGGHVVYYTQAWDTCHPGGMWMWTPDLGPEPSGRDEFRFRTWVMRNTEVGQPHGDHQGRARSPPAVVAPLSPIGLGAGQPAMTLVMASARLPLHPAL
jgi:hypothetical protein